MPKPGPSLSGHAGLAEWLPLLGSICQVLATLGDERENNAKSPDADLVQDAPSGEDRG